MLRQLKTIARAMSPGPVRTAWGSVYGGLKIRRARRAFAGPAPGAPAFLPAEHLNALMQGGYRPPDAVCYDADGLVVRAEVKIKQMARVIDFDAVRTALELGCWDGMVGAALIRRGIAAFGLDLVTRGFDVRAARAEVRFVQSDAEAIALRDASIDLVYSFASLEHFPSPDRCLAEVARVLRPGGQVYLEFGPLYFSPYGRHAYRQIPVPFCHLLFREEALLVWAQSLGLPHDWPYVNGWPLQRYRALWESLASRFAVVNYREHTTGGVGTELIALYPACFRGRVGDFDEFLVSAVEVTLCKR